MSTFTQDQIKRFANIFDNAGQVALGSLVISPLILGIESPVVITIGAFVMFLFWWLALRLERISS